MSTKLKSIALRQIYRRAVKDEAWSVVVEDMAVWRRTYPWEGQSDREIFVNLLIKYPEFRTLIYFRLPRLERYRWLIGEGMTQCHLGRAEIGPGLFLEHAWCTAIGVRRAGRNFRVGQEVTLGHGTDEDVPTVGDNVTIKAGAKVFGGITIGDNVMIGANAVVSKDVPSDCVVAGVPARIIRRKGVRCDEPLRSRGDASLTRPFTSAVRG